MKPVEQKKKNLIAAILSVYDKGLTITQVDKVTLYKRSTHGRVVSEKHTELIGTCYNKNPFILGTADICMRRGVAYKTFVECLTHEIGHFLVRHYDIHFPNAQTEEAWAQYFSYITFTGDTAKSLRDTKKYQAQPRLIRHYHFKRYKTQWKFVEEFGTIIGKSNRYRRFCNKMRKAYSAISG